MDSGFYLKGKRGTGRISATKKGLHSPFYANVMLAYSLSTLAACKPF